MLDSVYRIGVPDSLNSAVPVRFVVLRCYVTTERQKEAQHSARVAALPRMPKQTRTSECSEAPACDHSTRAAQVHEEVLRLFLAVAKQLSPEQLGRYLQTTIQRSRKSRRHAVQASAHVAGSSLMQAASIHSHQSHLDRRDP